MEKNAREASQLQKIFSRFVECGIWKEPRIPEKHVVIDFETLGLTNNDKIVQVGLCLADENGFSREFWDEDSYSLIFKREKEDFVGKERAIQVHGIDYEKSQAEGEDPVTIMRIICDVLQYAREHDYSIIGHNLYSFDMPMMDIEMGRCGITCDINSKDVVDTGLLVKAMQLHMLPSDGDKVYDFWERVRNYWAKGVYFSLDRYCINRFELDRIYGVDVSKAHDAGYDCMLTHYVAAEMNKLMQV